MQESSHTPSAVTPITLSLEAIMSLRHIYPCSPCADPRDLLLPVPTSVSQEELLLDAKSIEHPDTPEDIPAQQQQTPELWVPVPDL